MTIRRFPDAEALSRAAAEHIAELAEERDRLSIALSGGSTPKRTYEILAGMPVDWAKVHLFWGDERYVPSSDPASNERMVREALIDRIEIPAGNVHPIYRPEGYAKAAELYEAMLHEWFPSGGPTFDLALQGMGDDGHTASIFPGQIDHSDRWVVLSRSPVEPHQRISLTLDFLAASREVCFLVSGIGKADRLREVIEGDARYPASRLADKARNVSWWIDEGAGTLLPRT